MYYFGTLKNGNLTEVFFSRIKPSKKSHGHLYNYVTGGYKTKQIAMDQARQTCYTKIVFFDSRKKECHTTRNLNMIAGII